MIDLFSDLSEWIVDFADSEWATLILALNSFSESIFFPVPPDLLLIGISILKPDLALWLAALVTVSSVLGAVVGHWLGQRFGRPLLYRFVAETKVAAVERMFKKYGAWAVLMAAFTPIPYKVFAIAAGVLDLDRKTFIVASLIGRGARFFILGGLIFIFRDSIEEFVTSNFQNFQMLTIGLAAVLVMGLGIVAIVARRRRAGDPAA